MDGIADADMKAISRESRLLQRYAVVQVTHIRFSLRNSSSLMNSTALLLPS
jgi:hypothetical protein